MRTCDKFAVGDRVKVNKNFRIGFGRFGILPGDTGEVLGQLDNGYVDVMFDLDNQSFPVHERELDNE